MIKIMVAEDEPRSRKALEARLRSIFGERALVEGVQDGNEAVRKAESIRPQLIFMDVEMPCMNGIEAAQIIKARQPEVHVVFLTAYDRFDYAVGALRAGGEEYLVKPSSETELRETLEKFFALAPVEEAESPFAVALSVLVRQHYTDEMTLESAAESMHMSQFYFSRQVKAATGKTFLEYLTDYRIEKAKQRLDTTELTASEIGRAVGYSDANYFAKVFKRVTGMTPTAYRNRGNRE